MHNPTAVHFGTRSLQLLWLGLIVLSASVRGLAAPADPGISQQPLSGKTAVGEDFGFTVEPSGTAPFSYQWRFNNHNLAGATNQTLILTNITSSKAGKYSVRITNIFGAIISSNATLSIASDSPRSVTIDGPIDTSTGVVAQVTFFANGIENGLGFSLGYDTNVLLNPTFASALSNATANLDLSQTSSGLVGVTVALPPGETFSRGTHPVGALIFELAPGADPSQAAFYVTNTPVSIEATDTNGDSLTLKSELFLPITLIDPVPIVSAQSGLFIQRVEIANGTPNTLSNLVLGVHGLQKDLRTNQIFLYNRQFTENADLNDDGVNETTLESVPVPTLMPGQAVTLTMEFYVSDHVTVPTPEYAQIMGLTVTFRVPHGDVHAIRMARFVDGAFLVEFSTKTEFNYYVQYGSTMEELKTHPLTALPFIKGTGHAVQWSDTGPPKTRSAAQDGMRFYQVLEVDQ